MFHKSFDGDLNSQQLRSLENSCISHAWVKSTGGNMATGDAKESRDIPPGTKVVCTTCLDEKIEGEVVAFDYGSKVLIISILFHSDDFCLAVKYRM